jgi:hypothetical protein
MRTRGAILRFVARRPQSARDARRRLRLAAMARIVTSDTFAARGRIWPVNRGQFI